MKLHDLCGCRECQDEVLAMVELVDRREYRREGELSSLMDIVYRVCREAETSKEKTLTSL